MILPKDSNSLHYLLNIDIGLVLQYHSSSDRHVLVPDLSPDD